MCLVITKDGSPTMLSKEYNECYHSVTGAYEEAYYKFIRPSGVESLCLNTAVNVLDIGFGLGYNSFTTMEKCSNNGIVNIWAIDKNINVINKAKYLPYQNKDWNKWMTNIINNKKYLFEKSFINLLIGDARSLIKNIRENFDIVYLDPFSTSKNAELWTYDFFKLLRRKLNPKGLIITYSSALPVRSAFLRLGLYVYKTKPVSRRRGGTIASVIPLEKQKPLSEMDAYLLNHSDGSIPYRDNSLNCLSSDIISRRKKLIDYLLSKKKIYKVKHCYKKYQS